MQTIKQFRSALLAVVALAALFLLEGCPAPSKSCPNPNPLVIFDVPNAEGFSVTPDMVAQATSVVIEVSGNGGDPDTTFAGQPGVATIINLNTVFKRPLHLKFTYRSASKETIAEDHLRIDDTQNRGGVSPSMYGVVLPDMDIVMGLTTFPNCPSSTQTVSVSTNNGTSVFSWNQGETFEVIIVYNSTPYKFRIHPVAGVGDGAGTATIYERPSQTCLSDIATQPVSTKEMAITTIANDCTVRAWEDGTTRTVTIKHPTSASISVMK
ncbi:MAG: hypothetical protein ACKVUS_04750 [Saprospiraceae bacterium]